MIDNIDQFKPVLARIQRRDREWYEVIYYDGEWCSYLRSSTFADEDDVVCEWKYVEDCFDE